MTSSLIRGKYVICRASSDAEVQILEDGAVFQQDGQIVAVGTYSELLSRYQPAQIMGSSESVVLPGFVNGHHHLGITPFQLGSPDYPLEIWLTSRLVGRNVDPYLDTLYSAFEMVESGITTVQHIDMWQPSSAPFREQALQRANRILQAYQDVGMRASYSLAFRDQNRIVYAPDQEFIQLLPAHLKPEMERSLKAQAISLKEYLEVFETLWQLWHQEASGRIRLQLAPANLQWCSDHALLQQKEWADQYGIGMHMHLLETPYQYEYARNRSNSTAVRHLYELGLLGSHLTLGHAVWMTEEDIALIAETNTLICHNASSNLRLQSGIAPLNAFLNRKVEVAIGIDQAGINDDRDMLQEMRLVMNLHRVPGIDSSVPKAVQVFRMATEYGAKTTGFDQQIGTIEPGKAADLVLLNWQQIAYPFLDESVPVLDAVLYRGRSTAVETVIVAGEPILVDREFTKVNKQNVLEELAQSLRTPITQSEVRRRELVQELLPHIKQFYQGWLQRSICRPCWCRNCRYE